MSAGRFEWQPTRFKAVDAATGITCKVEPTGSAWCWELRDREGALMVGGLAGSAADAKGEAHKRVERAKAAGEEKRR